PKRLLRESAEACRKVQYIEYREEQVTSKEKGGPLSVAQVRQARANVPDAGFLPGKFSVEGESSRDGPKPRRFAFSYDGKSLRLLDPTDKVVRVVPSPGARLAGSLLGSDGLTGVPQFTQDRPFQHLLENTAAVEHQGMRVVQGVPCHVIAET